MQNLGKEWYKSKTIWFNFIILALSTIELYSNGLQGFFSDPKYFSAFMVFVSSTNAILRFVTKQPINLEKKTEVQDYDF